VYDVAKDQLLVMVGRMPIVRELRVEHNSVPVGCRIVRVMERHVFLNLPVADLARSKEFFTGLGWSFNPQFTNDNAACLEVGGTVHAMLMPHAIFALYTTKEIVDSHRQAEVMIAFTCESREEVERLVGAALQGGGTIPRPPQDHGFLYGASFEDLDGHVWEPFWMDPAGMPGGGGG
jgi:predicted lactoylglutathione lyase